MQTVFCQKQNHKEVDGFMILTRRILSGSSEFPEEFKRFIYKPAYSIQGTNVVLISDGTYNGCSCLRLLNVHEGAVFIKISPYCFPIYFKNIQSARTSELFYEKVIG